MDRKNMALILSIFLFIGLLFSVDTLERQHGGDYDEQHQVYSAGAGRTTAVSIVKNKNVKRTAPLLVGILFLTYGMLWGTAERWAKLYFKRTEMLYFLKQVRVSQRMDGKKRTL